MPKAIFYLLKGDYIAIRVTELLQELGCTLTGLQVQVSQSIGCHGLSGQA